MAAVAAPPAPRPPTIFVDLTVEDDDEPAHEHDEPAHACAICLQDMLGRALAAADPCGHVFCSTCLAHAVDRSGQCPKCAVPVVKCMRLYL